MPTVPSLEEPVLAMLPWLLAMVFLMGCSAFFSASEAALFSLRPKDRRVLKSGTATQKRAASLLSDPERLLSAVLFWNLVVNVAYFAIASIVENSLPPGSPLVWPLRAVALLLIIFFSEMLPKTIAVLISRRLAASVSIPLSVLVRMVDPIMPVLRLMMLVSQRLIWPGHEPEQGLEAADLERAIELSTGDAKLLDQEQSVLRNIIGLSNLRVDESMRPRTHLLTFTPPVALTDLEGELTPSGYLFITEGESDNITAALRLRSVWSINPQHLEAEAETVIYVPWCATVADSFALMQQKDRDVVVVVDEWGHTIGALTMDDILDLVFTDNPNRSQRLLNRDPIQPMDQPGLWKATGMTNLRKLGEYFKVELPASHRNTIGGAMQESLQRMPLVSDICKWGPFEFEVVDIAEDGQMTIHVHFHPVLDQES